MAMSDSMRDLAWALPIVSAFMSILGSTIIVVMMLRSIDMRLSSTYGRLVFGMSCMDIMQSLAHCFSTLPSPIDSDAHWQSYGTTLTCSIQGWFLFTGGVGTTIYYCSLCIYYALRLSKRDITDSTIRNKIEPFLHFIPLAYSIAAGIFLGVTKHFNNAGPVCWISAVPQDCLQEEDMECIRGENAHRYRIMFQAIPILIVFFIVFICMIILICTVDRQAKRMEKYKPKGTKLPLAGSVQQNTRPCSEISSMIQQMEDTKVQGLFYIGAYFCTFLFPIIHQLTYILSGHFIYILFIMQNLTAPLQGFFNFIVYIRPHFKEFSKDYPEMSFFGVFLKSIQSKGDEHCRRPTKRENHLKQTDQQVSVTTHESHDVEKDTDKRNYPIV